MNQHQIKTKFCFNNSCSHYPTRARNTNENKAGLKNKLRHQRKVKDLYIYFTLLRVLKEKLQ